ncbi:MAG: LPS export ABC transporter periplasmic protein LptC, partial [Candidatus Omnitrophica bacterium]|nr:LPS export ABC transporter periplasmic protein LptC [Candidatus Omnitrophota bacterium]
MILVVLPSYAADEPIECNGDQVEYFEKEKKVVGSGNVVIKYKEMELTCDEVTVWTESYDAEAEGNAVITEGDNIFSGTEVKYNFRDNTGYVRDFEGFSEPWYTKGKEAE